MAGATPPMDALVRAWGRVCIHTALALGGVPTAVTVLFAGGLGLSVWGVWLRPRVEGAARASCPRGVVLSAIPVPAFSENEAAARLTSGCDCHPGEL